MNNTEHGKKAHLPPGIYERLIDEETENDIRESEHGPVARKNIADAGVTPEDALALHINGQLRAVFAEQELPEQLETANAVLEAINKAANRGTSLGEEVLLAVEGGKFDKASLHGRPSTSIAKNAVFTASKADPQLWHELVREIRTADSVDMVVSFIMWSGIDVLMSALADFARRGGKLRVITTTYMCHTQFEAVDWLARLRGTEVRISYDTSRTHLHAKSYIFRRESGYSTAYVGSSNISAPALTAGYEWNAKIAAVESPDVYEKISVTFDEHWSDDQFELYDPYDPEQRRRLKEILNHGTKPILLPQIPAAPRLEPFVYQEEILERLRAERELHHSFRNLLVAATGTGKTVISAFDYRRWCEEHPGEPCNMLFVAHRKEILEQSLETFRTVLGDENFGELHVGDSKASMQDNLFISIQSINAVDLCEKQPKKHYQYIVVDEFHHAAAPSYQKLLSHFEPDVLLGLTATPERHDRKSILEYFGGRVAAEIRLPEAIDTGLLCPFHYFGLEDTVDLDQVKWVRGGYDEAELDNLYSLNKKVAEKRAAHILGELRKHARSIDSVKALGFCVSVRHAEFMNEYFNEHGVPSEAVSGKTEEDVREQAVKKLAEGETKVIFCVDVFNEGVDIPTLNTVMFLRPTQSLTVFLQQFGRGLRLSPGKEYLMVLDFIGAANRNYRFDEKFGAMLRPHANLDHETRNGFSSVPRGCSIELEEKPMKAVLQVIRQGFNRKPMLVEKIREYKEEFHAVPTLSEYLARYHMSPLDVYKTSLYSRLVAEAENREMPYGKADDAFCTGLKRLSLLNSPAWMQYLADTLPVLKGSNIPANVRARSEKEQLMLAMLSVTIWEENLSGLDDKRIDEHLQEIVENDVWLREIIELLKYLVDQNKQMVQDWNAPYPCPLEVNGTYGRSQIQAALGKLDVANMREGVFQVPDKKTFVLLVTIHKGPDAIAYEDYAVDRTLFHWQSQNQTGPDTAVGQAYINQGEEGTQILLFVRLSDSGKYGTTTPYRFVGPVQFVSSTGARPMSILWKLVYPIDPEFASRAGRLAI